MAPIDKSLKSKSARWHTVYSIISVAIQTIALTAALIWLLPLFNINIPMWWIVFILVIFLIYSYIMYRIGHPTVLYKSVSDPNSIIGNEGVVEVALNPEGYVRVRGELWKASSADGPLDKGDEIKVTGLAGMKLTVEKKT